MRREEPRTGRIADMEFQFDGGHRHRQLGNETINPQRAKSLLYGLQVASAAVRKVAWAKSRAVRRDA